MGRRFIDQPRESGAPVGNERESTKLTDQPSAEQGSVPIQEPRMRIHAPAARSAVRPPSLTVNELTLTWRLIWEVNRHRRLRDGIIHSADSLGTVPQPGRLRDEPGWARVLSSFLDGVSHPRNAEF